ncbi:MAG: 30S ribosomal protein S19 [Candidatus Thermoplasmatota archaeon]|nr:30S ribosomal protein S19 [Candidatus Thermoplasmatota archaeon]
MPKRGGSAKAARRRARKKAGAAEARRKREFTYRGHTLEELQALSLQEILAIMPSRVRRTFSRGLSQEHGIVLEKLRSSDGKLVRTHRRDIPILPYFVGREVAVHNGREFVRFEIRPEMIGHYLGEFALTRKPVKHSGPGVGATRSSKFLPLK